MTNLRPRLHSLIILAAQMIVLNACSRSNMEASQQPDNSKKTQSAAAGGSSSEETSNPPTTATSEQPTPVAVIPARPNPAPPAVVPSAPPAIPPAVVPSAPPAIPPAVVPSAPPAIPPAVIPSAPPAIPPAVIPEGNLLFPAACLANMENGYHVTDNGYIAQLKDKGGAVVAAGKMSMKAVTDGFTCDAKTPLGCYVLNIELTYQKVSTGAQNGTFSLCKAVDSSVPPEKAFCQVLPGESSPPSKNDSPDPGVNRRTFQYINLPVQFTGEGRSLKITEYAGMPGDPKGVNTLLVFHPMFLFAAPVACMEDLVSPLVLDIAGNGDLDLTNVWDDAKKVSFDLRNQGLPVRTGWIGSKSGFLVYDVGSPELIKDGSYLFGENTNRALATANSKSPTLKNTFRNGFEALRQLDSNHDGVISKSDHDWSKLKIWRNKAFDGVAKSSEMKSLDEVNIVEISLRYQSVPKASQARADGNKEVLTATFKTSEGKTHKISDVLFKQRESLYSFDGKGMRPARSNVGGGK